MTDTKYNWVKCKQRTPAAEDWYIVRLGDKFCEAYWSGKRWDAVSVQPSHWLDTQPEPEPEGSRLGRLAELVRESKVYHSFHVNPTTRFVRLWNESAPPQDFDKISAAITHLESQRIPTREEAAEALEGLLGKLQYECGGECVMFDIDEWDMALDTLRRHFGQEGDDGE